MFQDQQKQKKAVIGPEKGLWYINQKGKEIQGKTVKDVFFMYSEDNKKGSVKKSGKLKETPWSILSTS